MHRTGLNKSDYHTDEWKTCILAVLPQVQLHCWLKGFCGYKRIFFFFLIIRGKNGVYIFYLLQYLYIMSFLTFPFSFSLWLRELNRLQFELIGENRQCSGAHTYIFLCIFCALWLKTSRRLLTGAHFQVREFFLLALQKAQSHDWVCFLGSITLDYAVSRTATDS